MNADLISVLSFSGNETDVTEEQSGTDSVDVYRNIVVGAVVGVVLVAIVIVIVVLRKKCGRSSEQRKSKTGT